MVSGGWGLCLFFPQDYQEESFGEGEPHTVPCRVHTRFSQLSEGQPRGLS